MRVLSLFSGIDAASVALLPLGYEIIGFSEIDKHACKVLQHHYPNTPNLGGDVTKITEDQIKGLGHIDLVIWGSPCTNLSITGNRQGLNGDESILFWDGIRIVDWARQHCGLRFSLWENVPGAFTSNGGNDFAEVVGAMAGIEHVTVPSEKWQSEGAAVGSKGMLEWACLDAKDFGLAARRNRVFAICDFGDWRSRPPILLERKGMRRDYSAGRKTEQSTTPEITGCATGTDSVSTFRRISHGEYVSSDHGSTVISNASADQSDLVTFAIQGTVVGRSLNAGPNGSGYSEELCFTLTASDRHVVATHNAVRRLTPIENERLMGFPDGYTSMISDPQRYKALGNSMAVPVIQHIGRNILKAIRKRIPSVVLNASRHAPPVLDHNKQEIEHD